MAVLNWRDDRINRNRNRSLPKKLPIPGGINLDDFRTIQTYLEEMFADIEDEIGQTGLA
jgi:hypothetical protein